MSTTPDTKNITKIIINTLIVLVILAGIIRGIQYYTKYKNHKSTRETTTDAVSAEKLLPIDFEAHRLTAEHFCATGRPEKALEHYQRILSFQPKDRELRYSFATASLDAGDYERALKELSFLSMNKPADSLTPKIAARKGVALFYLNRIAESKEELKRCLAQSPGTAEAVCFLGQIEATEGDSTKALSDLEKAVSLDSSYVEGWYQLARYRMEHGKYAKAQQLLQQALEIDPLNGKSHARLGMVYYYLENKTLAKKSYLTAIALNPKDFNTRYNLAELYYTAFADTENALREYNATLKINPDHVEANFKVGLICLRNNMVKESIRYFRNALKTDPENVRILLQLGVAYEKIGDQEHALKVYQKVVAVDALNSIAIQKIKYLSKR